MSRLSEIRARVEAATPGPWFVVGGILNAPDEAHGSWPLGRLLVDPPNRALVEHAREDLAYLLGAFEHRGILRTDEDGSVWCRAERPFGIVDDNGNRWVRVS